MYTVHVSLYYTACVSWNAYNVGYAGKKIMLMGYGISMKGIGATVVGGQGLEQCSQCMHVLDLLGSFKSFTMTITF